MIRRISDAEYTVTYYGITEVFSSLDACLTWLALWSGSMYPQSLEEVH